MHANTNCNPCKALSFHHTSLTCYHLRNYICLPPVHWPGFIPFSPLTLSPVGWQSAGQPLKNSNMHSLPTPGPWEGGATVTRRLVVTAPPSEPPTYTSANSPTQLHIHLIPGAP